MPSRRSYNQYCSVARALDMIGDRWTLLVVRELMIGPRRFTDLLDGLPGIGPNHLTARLRRLDAAGVVARRRLSAPAPARVYELTERGRGLEPVLVGLARWGTELLGSPDPELEWRADWTVVALRGRFDADAACGVNEAYQFVVDAQPFWVRVRDGELSTGLGHVEAPALTISADRDSFTRVAAGELSVAAAVEGGSYVLDGDPAAIARAALIFPAPEVPQPAFPTPGATL